MTEKETDIRKKIKKVTDPPPAIALGKLLVCEM